VTTRENLYENGLSGQTLERIRSPLFSRDKIKTVLKQSLQTMKSITLAFTVSTTSVLLGIIGCAQTNFDNPTTDPLGRSYCAPGTYDKSNTSGRYYSPSVDKCVEGKVFQKDHELCVRGPYNTGQVEQAINYNPKVDQCIEGIVIPNTSAYA